MRALRVVGVTGDGSVVLEDPGRRERYTVPADEQLRAAARGDVTRLGQIAIELESQLRPREIQARIRGGASVDEVAAAAGVPTQKIERFAYPVLLERSRTAELAQGAHPQRTDGPDSRTLGETVAHTFGLRGQDFSGAGWDSWKGEDGKWVIALTWQTGRSDNAAHWAFQPGAHGGTVVPLDEHASDLVEELPARPLRPLGAVVDMARDDETPAPEPAEPARAVAGGQAPQPTEAWAGRGIAPEQRRSSLPPRGRVDSSPRTTTRTEDTRPTAAPDTGRTEPAAPVANGSGSNGTGSQGSGTNGSAVNSSGADDSGPDVADAPEETAATGPATDTAEPAGTTARTEEPAEATRPTVDTTPPSANADRAPDAEPATVANGATDTRTATPADPGASETSVDSGAARPAAPAAAAPASSTSADADGTASADEAPAATAATSEPDAADAGEEPQGAEAPPRQRSTPASRRTKKGKPVMPSWDEVLLGVRGQR